ncbi:hypothetical protein AAC387_Pa04g2348 [Persea americana]
MGVFGSCLSDKVKFSSKAGISSISGLISVEEIERSVEGSLSFLRHGKGEEKLVEKKEVDMVIYLCLMPVLLRKSIERSEQASNT